MERLQKRQCVPDLPTAAQTGATEDVVLGWMDGVCWGLAQEDKFGTLDVTALEALGFS